MARQHKVREYTRVRNGKVETVRQHTRGSGGGNNNDNNNGGLGPLGKVIVGGIALYVLGSIGLGWIEDVKDGIDKAKEVRELAKEAKELEKAEAKDAKESAKAEKKLEKDINSQGYTEKFDVDEDDIGIEAGDIRDILEKIEEQVDAYINSEDGVENIIYLEGEAFDNSDNYKASVCNRLKTMDGETVTFIAIYQDLGKEKANEKYDNICNLLDMNLQEYIGVYKRVDLKGYKGYPDNGDLTVAFTYSVE